MTSCVSYRIEVDDLERTSIEEEVLDVSFDQDNQEHEVEDIGTTHASDQEVKRILPEDVVQTEFSLVSTSKILELLYQLHGHTLFEK